MPKIKAIKPGKRVLVTAPSCPPFEGVVVFAGEWENPMSVTRKFGVNYHVKADDDGYTYKDIDDTHVKKIN